MISTTYCVWLAHLLTIGNFLGGSDADASAPVRKASGVVEISITTADMWCLRCIPNGSGHISQAGNVRVFKSDTVAFESLVEQVRELSMREGRLYARDNKVVPPKKTEEEITAQAWLQINLTFDDGRSEFWVYGESSKSTSRLVQRLFEAAVDRRAALAADERFEQVWQEQTPMVMAR